MTPPFGHILYRDGDADAPASIRDRNGAVVLDLCRCCGKAEGELNGLCTVSRWDVRRDIPHAPSPFPKIRWIGEYLTYEKACALLARRPLAYMAPHEPCELCSFPGHVEPSGEPTP